MLNLNKKTGYALIAMAHLASPAGRVASAGSLAKRFDIPPRLLMNVMKQLAASDMVRSVRGAHGGYVLAIDPHELTLGQLVRTMEGQRDMALCSSAERGLRTCRLIDRCPARWPVHRVQEKLREFLDGITLAEITAGSPGGEAESFSQLEEYKNEPADLLG